LNTNETLVVPQNLKLIYKRTTSWIGPMNGARHMRLWYAVLAVAGRCLAFAGETRLGVRSVRTIVDQGGDCDRTTLKHLERVDPRWRALGLVLASRALPWPVIFEQEQPRKCA
jgi:hypothetical protein